MPRPLLLGHRGQCDTRGPIARRFRSSTLPAENTIAAFELALQRGCDGVEFDVRYTHDRRGVVCHDPDYAGFNVASATFDVLAAPAHVHHPDTHERLVKMPSLEDVLARFATRAYLDIEIKVPGFEEEVVAAIEQHRPQRGFVVSSFLPQVLQRFHEFGPQLPLGYICKDRKLLPNWRELPVSVVIPHFTLVLDVLMREWHEEGKQVFVWTVNRRDDMLRMRDLGVDAIISDATAQFISMDI